VGVVTDVLDVLEADAAFTGFHLDGQTALVDDHLAVVAGDEPRIRALLAAGRLTVGPWAVLADSFLPSGETLARNLERGLARSAELGAVLAVGWLPDSFGHAAQLPQLLARAGIDHAVVWRGVPAAVGATSTAFRWRAPDGTTVRAEVLVGGYDVGGHLPVDPVELVARIADHVGDIGERLVGDALWPQGGDHQPIRRALPGRVATASTAAADAGLELVITTPAALVERPADDPGLALWEGELRSGAASNVLAAVASTRVDVKAAAAAAEIALERVAETLATLRLPPGDPAHRLVAMAWDLLVANAAHDSTCACSADATVADVLGRYRAAADIAAEVTARALVGAHDGDDDGEALVVNSVHRARRGVVEVTLAGEGPLEGAQVLEQRAAELIDVTVPAALVAPLLDRVRTQQVNDTTWVTGLDIDETPELVTVTAACGPEPASRLDLAMLRARAEAVLAADPARPVRIRAVQRAMCRALVVAGPVPGYGSVAWLPGPRTVDPVTVDDATLANGLVSVVVDRATGTFAIDGVAGFGALVDEPEAGDTYTHQPGTGPVVEVPEQVTVEVVEHGPVRGVVRIVTAWDWRGTAATVVTDVTVLAGERLVRVEHRCTNPAGDHRLRVLVPLPVRVDEVVAGCAFAAVHRGRWNEGGLEAACPTAPARRFVLAGALAVVVPGVVEYELGEGGDRLALTVLRAVGVLSRPGLAVRPVNAGPALEVPDAQLLGRTVTCRYGIALGENDALTALAFADDLSTPLLVTHGVQVTPALVVDGPVEVSTVRRHAGAVEVRLWNPSDRPVVAAVDDRPLALGPWEIAVVRIPPPN
jgi:hypothetical protein